MTSLVFIDPLNVCGQRSRFNSAPLGWMPEKIRGCHESAKDRCTQLNQDLPKLTQNNFRTSPCVVAFQSVGRKRINNVRKYNPNKACVTRMKKARADFPEKAASISGR